MRVEMLREAVDAARSKLCASYAKADAIVYPVATIIDPRVKLTYHKREGWEEERVLEASAAIKQAFGPSAARRGAASFEKVRAIQALQASARQSQGRAQGIPGRAGGRRRSGL
jgi:hypothetical protein